METILAEYEVARSLTEVIISKDLALLKIQANQNDPLIFQTFFCVTCQEFVPASGLFPPPEQHTPGHPLAWVPAVDEPAPGRPQQAISRWLAEDSLSTERRRFLEQEAPKSNSLCWALIIEPEERDGWFEFFANYLNDLADAWLSALNGLDSLFFTANDIWFRPRPAYHFQWQQDEQTDD